MTLQTCRDTTYHFGIDYPPDYVLVERGFAADLTTNPLHIAAFLTRQLAQTATAKLQPPAFVVHVFRWVGGKLILALALAACMPIQPNAVPATQNATTPEGHTERPASSPATAGVLANTRWQLLSFGPVGAPGPVLPGAPITLEFRADGQAGGSGGCNSYSGTYQVQGSTLTFGQVVSSMRACADNSLNEQEQRYFEALQAAGRYQVTGRNLTIWFDNGRGVLNFSAAT